MIYGSVAIVPKVVKLFSNRFGFGGRPWKANEDPNNPTRTVELSTSKVSFHTSPKKYELSVQCFALICTNALVLTKCRS